LKWLKEELSQGKPKCPKQTKQNFSNTSKSYSIHIADQLCFLQKIRVDIAEICVVEKTTKLRPNQTIQIKQTV